MKIHTSSPKGLLGPRSVGADRGHFIYRIAILEFSAEFRAIKLGDWRFVSKTQSFSVHPVGLEPTTFGSEGLTLNVSRCDKKCFVVLSYVSASQCLLERTCGEFYWAFQRFEA